MTIVKCRLKYKKTGREQYKHNHDLVLSNSTIYEPNYEINSTVGLSINTKHLLLSSVMLLQKVIESFK